MEKDSTKIQKSQKFAEILSEAILGLKENEKRTISGRFGLSGKKETLASIGRELRLSRERIRQIENCGLKHLRVNLEKNNPELLNKILEDMKKSGGVVTDESFSPQLILNFSGHKFGKNYLKVVFSLLKEVKEIKKSNNLIAGWRLSNISENQINRACQVIIKYFNDTKLPEDMTSMLKNVNELKKYENEFVKNCIAITPKIAVAKNQLIGITSWPSVNPRKVRDKIYYVLKTHGKPLHFSEIASRISEMKFDNKKVVRATVHNELIADIRFVLIGRGIYALREWGYSDGTVYQVIRNILSNAKKPVSLGEIVALVNDVRKVKKNTIMINLQAKKEFKKVASGYVYEKL
ncbi:MAG: hypothetical protein Athens101428_262 [Candidatus Berkelbacteria bacterium Athens1014_28]|uniref:HTH HARE-type domain-containing protein n=1 Tax=Candidatus Berkelbacteria bacterium Athens1014_28 TaxID=2017145 RepID=A0A554LNR4_9BACT|nr:MAG: hypothetical protein Athens101428_262 [Candidatus Berkelbacteria bacterium Athens1014_28]